MFVYTLLPTATTKIPASVNIFRFSLSSLPLYTGLPKFHPHPILRE
jgi:hypothetical protein